MPRRARNIIADREPASFRHHARKFRNCRMLLASVSLATLLLATAEARAVPLYSARGGSASATATAAAAAMASVQQAQQATQQSMSSLLRASQAVAAMQQTQSAARALAQGASIAGPGLPAVPLARFRRTGAR